MDGLDSLMHRNRSPDGSVPSKTLSLGDFSFDFLDERGYSSGSFWPMFSRHLVYGGLVTNEEMVSFLLVDVLGFSYGDSSDLLGVNKGLVLRRRRRANNVIQSLNKV